MRVVFFHKRTGLEARARDGKLLLNLFRKGNDDKFHLREGTMVSLNINELGEIAPLLLSLKGKVSLFHKVGDRSKVIELEGREDKNNSRVLWISVRSENDNQVFTLNKGEAYVLWRLVNLVIDDFITKPPTRAAEISSDATVEANPAAEGEIEDAGRAVSDEQRGNGGTRKRRRGTEQPPEPSEEFPF